MVNRVNPTQRMVHLVLRVDLADLLLLFFFVKSSWRRGLPALLSKAAAKLPLVAEPNLFDGELVIWTTPVDV